MQSGKSKPILVYQSLVYLVLQLFGGYFFIVDNNVLLLLVAKMFGDTLATGESAFFKNFVSDLNVCIDFKTVAHGSGRFRFFPVNITQEENFSRSIDTHGKLLSLEP